MASPPIPNLTPAEAAAAESVLRLAAAEDLGPHGDVTSNALLPADTPGQGVYRAREPGVMAGMACMPILLDVFEADVEFDVLVADGQAFEPGQDLAVVRGRLRPILTLERTSLNLLQRLSGVATLARRYVEAVADSPAHILDTRKTTPGWRLLEKYAVRAGGADNHRIGLYDQVLIKDNHLAGLTAAAGADVVAVAVARAREHAPGLIVILEVDTLDQLAAALRTDVDVVLLDNMPPDVLRRAVAMRDAGPHAPAPALEASGGVTMETVCAIAATGVDRISVGQLTHSARAVDISLDMAAAGPDSRESDPVG